MKKFLKSLIAIALLLTMAMSVTACKKSKKESDDDSKQSQAFPAAEVVVANFKKVGYDVDADAEYGYEFGVAIVLCVEGWDDGDDWLEIYYVASASDAKAMLTAFEIEYWEEIQEECSEYGVKAVKGTSGSVFYFGTENALKVAKTGKAPAVSESTPQVSGIVNIDNVKSKLEKAGYTVMLYEGEAAKEFGEGVTAVLTAIKGADIMNTISFVWYASVDDAKRAEEGAKEELKEMGDEADNYVVERSGKCVWMGSKEAAKVI